ncbi:uncharacterized protein OCT59_023363 [Rhizophagus irregularis]|uniref:uncharacterized protein n=1 Tax=Rhizophagus irregularis TaxID=588596 RepID=UPI003321CFD3|nr:hypothetical protein OCT59_023363 [Rhizophagus irregularis]
MGKQWFSVLAALRKKVFCSLRARKFCNAEQFEEDRDKGKFKVNDESVEKVVEVINDLRSENQSTSDTSGNLFRRNLV